jgi:transaldolase / glucose-6-phosphate isomerase
MFGLVPAALAGIDVSALIQDARWMTEACVSGLPEDRNPALRLGAALGRAGARGRDKLTFLVDPPFTALPAWLEQLIAESTGKNGTGIVPDRGRARAAGGRLRPRPGVRRHHASRVISG